MSFWVESAEKIVFDDQDCLMQGISLHLSLFTSFCISPNSVRREGVETLPSIHIYVDGDLCFGQVHTVRMTAQFDGAVLLEVCNSTKRARQCNDMMIRIDFDYASNAGGPTVLVTPSSRIAVANSERGFAGVLPEEVFALLRP